MSRLQQVLKWITGADTGFVSQQTQELFVEFRKSMEEVMLREREIMKGRNDAVVYLATLPDPTSRDMVETLIVQMDKTLDAMRPITGTPAPPPIKVTAL